MTVGDIDNSFLRYPWGAILAVNYLYLLVVLHAQSDKWPILKRLCDRYACVSSLASMVVMTIVFGLTGTGYFDMVAYEKFHDGKMSDYIPTDEDLQAGFEGIPKFQGNEF